MSAIASSEEPFFLPAELDEIRRVFFDQGREALDGLDQGLLSIEGQPPTPERLRSLRRGAHTLKGDFATVGFPGLSTLAHVLEDAFEELEQRGGVVTPRDIDRLLGAIDALRRGLEAGARGEPEPNVAAWVATLSESAAPIGELELGLEAGRQRGLHALRLTASWRGTRRPEPLVAKLAQLLDLEILATGRTTAGDDEHAVWLAALCPCGPAEIEARAEAVRGVQVRAEVWRAAPASIEEAPLPLAAARELGVEGETIRIEAARVDEVLTLVGEMVIARSAIAGVAGEIETWLPNELSTRLFDAVGLLGRVLQELQRGAMRMRMVPAERVFRRFSRAVRDLRRRTGKQLALHIEGEQTELDRGILDALEEPLLHLVRNAADHGIEPARERVLAGKPAEGSVLLRASREGNQVLIEVTDDGRGIDAAAVRERAVKNGLVPADTAHELSDAAALQLVFLPGLSTAAEITETSGRGIGLDVVRETVESLKGSVQAMSIAGQGTTILIRVPLTVAIIRALLFRAGGRELAVPLSSVAEIAQREHLVTQRFGGHEMLRLRDEVLTLVHPADVLGSDIQRTEGRFVIVVQGSAGRFGLLADELAGEHELVIKAVHDRWIRTPLVAGAAVLAGGGLVLILDVAAVYRAALGRTR